ncbi:unnamed protein product, partial [Amoebophrya sp. A25]|eukprot:GSA25T00028071001.1
MLFIVPASAIFTILASVLIMEKIQRRTAKIRTKFNPAGHDTNPQNTRRLLRSLRENLPPIASQEPRAPSKSPRP